MAQKIISKICEVFNHNTLTKSLIQYMSKTNNIYQNQPFFTFLATKSKITFTPQTFYIVLYSPWR